jgi:aryl-alcohol dehydrogenase-like predicted oxidoreductase
MTNSMTATLPDSSTIPRLGLGTWAIGGRWTAGGEAAGWGDTDDDISRAAIRAGVAAGVRLFDTAQAYGAGHAERLLGEVLAAHPEVRIATKVGYIVNEDARVLERQTTDPDEIEASLDASRQRLQRDRIDIVLLHLNSLPPAEAAPVFDRLEMLRARGWIGHYGWSTDYPDSATSMTGRAGFAVVEHAMNVFFAADGIGAVLARHDLLPLIRSPLAMGLLGGRYGAGHRFGPDDVRSRTMDWMDYFRDGQVTDAHAAMFDRLRDLLASGGRSPAQGALAWILARSPRAVPLPGFRTPEQVTDLCGVLASGPLEAATMDAIETAMQRPPEGPPRDR